MKFFQFLLVSLLLFPLHLSAQNIALSREASLFERPDSSSVMKMMLPAGIELQILSEQGDWQAVSTSTGVVGWIHRTANEEEDAGDLIRSIQELSEDADDPGVSEQPQPQQTTRNAPPPPAPLSGAPSNADGDRETGAGMPAAAGTAGNTSAPPPPPARPPGQDTDAGSFGAPPPSSPPLTSIIAGIYDKYQWISAAFELRDQFKRLDLQYNSILGKITQLGGWLTGTDGFLLPTPNLDDLGFDGFESERQYDRVAKISRAETRADIKSLEGGLRVGVFPMASTGSDFGLYLGALAGYGVLSGDAAPEDIIGVATLGGEGAIFFRIGSSNSPQFIPSAQVQFARKELICESESFSCGIDQETGDSNSTVGDNNTTIRLGLEMNYHGLVPGVHLTLIETPAEDKTFESIFGFSFTFAY